MPNETPAAPPIAFIDLGAQRRRLGDRIERAVARVLEQGAFIMGPDVAELEKRLAAFTGARHCVTCANGTDALQLALMTKGIGPGDAVFVPAFTFVASAEAPAILGATPWFVDVLEDTFNMDPASLEAAIAAARAAGQRPAAVIPVDLFGQPADYRRLLPIARAEGLFVLADAAQSLGGALDGRRVGVLGDATAVSFFPAKPLGCYGDGGAVFTDDDETAARLRSIRVHGQGAGKYDNVRLGLNSRLDTLQAAILLEKLAIFDEELEARDRVAAAYAAAVAEIPAVVAPSLIPGARSAWAQYTLTLPNRDAAAARLRAAGTPTMVYYPIPLSRQEGYRGYPTAPGGTPVAERLASTVLSLPMHPYLDPATQNRIIAALNAAIRDAAAGL